MVQGGPHGFSHFYQKMKQTKQNKAHIEKVLTLLFLKFDVWVSCQLCVVILYTTQCAGIKRPYHDKIKMVMKTIHIICSYEQILVKVPLILKTQHKNILEQFYQVFKMLLKILFQSLPKNYFPNCMLGMYLYHIFCLSSAKY